MDMTIGEFIRTINEENRKFPSTIKKVVFNIVTNVRTEAIRNVDRRLNKSGFSKGALRNSLILGVENGIPLVEAGGAGVPYAAAHEFGATIIPKNVNWLTIPNGRENYGKNARDFDNLFFRLINPQLAALVDKNTGQVIFWLKKQVKIQKKSYLTDAGETVMDRQEEHLKRALASSQIWSVE